MTLVFYFSAFDLYGLAQLRESSGLAAGDEHLTGHDLVQDEFLPSGIQLGKDIVQQEHRLFAELPGHQLPLGKLQADGGGTGLTLGAVCLQVDPRKGHGEVILVGTRQALPGVQLRPVVPLQMLLEIPVQHAHRGEGVRDIGNGLVLQGEFLGAAGKLSVKNGRFLSKALIESGPVGDQQSAHLAETGIEVRQDLQQRGVLPPVLQDPALLVQDPVVLRKGGVIVGSKLT